MNCSHCSKEIEKGTGMMFVKKMGAIRYFCSKRCYKYDVLYKKKPNQKEIRERGKKAMKVAKAKAAK
ncbi:MAG: 50S ribosomal protein L24e [Candidatus Micrarchaeota archaeon]|nr:50S ribosomal protein L24e [Candidatus Micrarchaeota archaeon]